VALAAVLGPCRCEILTDIDGVYTALPSICREAKKLHNLTYEEMLEMASSGAKVLQARSVSLAHKFKVPLVVCSSFNDVEGTNIVEEYTGMEDAVVSGITCRNDEAKLTLRNIPDQPGVAAKVFKAMGNAEVVVDMIVQSQGAGGKAAISFTVPRSSASLAYDTLVKLVRDEMPEATVEIDKDIAKLSVVGEGMRTHAGVASKVFEILGREHINVEMITTSEIKISIAIKEKYSELAVRVLHEAFIEA
jgi:aspartate kinase